MKPDTLRTIINAANTASKDPTRYSLQCILLKANNSESVSIVATNGSCLSENIVPDSELSELLKDRRFLVEIDNIPALKQVYKQWQRISIPIKEMDNRLVFGIGTEVTVKTETEMGFNFPAYEEVKPKNLEEYATEICFNPQLLMAVFKALNSSKANGVKLKIKDQHHPIVVEHDGQVGLVMPMRI